PVWDPVTLPIGQCIAKGESKCQVTPPPAVQSLAVEMQVAWLARLQADFPVVPLGLDRQDIQIQGVGGIREVIEVKQRLLTTLKEPVSTRTLHQALDAYSAYVAEKYKDKPSNRPQQLSISLLRQHTEDFTLDRLDADRIETW